MPTWYPDMATGSDGLSAASRPAHMRSHRIPPELVAGGVRRLGTISIGVAGVFTAMLTSHVLARQVGLEVVAQALVGGRWGFVIAVLTVLLSLAMAVVTRRKSLDLTFVTDLGRVYAVVCAFGMSMLENLVYWPQAGVARGVSWVAIWIVLFPLMVPSTPGRSWLTGLASAAMGPLAYMIMVVLGNPVAPMITLGGLFLPSFVAVVLADIVSRAFYELSQDVSEARQMGNYRLVERLGRGGMGEVWRAEHRRLKRSAAVKFIRPDTLAGDSTTEARNRMLRFEREAAATAQLSSPHTVELYDFGVADDGTLFYVMELLVGMDTNTLVKRFGPLPAERVQYLLAQACRSLAEAHEVGLIHRDIKPANLVVCRRGTQVDFTKVLDFGLVRSAREGLDTEELTAEGLVGGTPGYLAPELVFADRQVDHRADLYALGCVAYWLLTGEPVFTGDSAVKVVMQHVNVEPVPPSQRTELEVPAALEAVVMKCLAKDPADRPESGRALGNALAGIETASAWTQARAQDWWQKHLPELAVPMREAG